MHDGQIKENISPNISPIKPAGTPQKRTSDATPPPAKRILSFPNDVIVPETPPALQPKVSLLQKDAVEVMLQSELAKLQEQFTESINAIRSALLYNDAQNPYAKLTDDDFVEWLSNDMPEQYGDLVKLKIAVKNQQKALLQHLQNKKLPERSAAFATTDVNMVDVIPATPSQTLPPAMAYPWYFENEISTLVDLDVKSFAGYRANHQFRLAGIGETGTYPDEDNLRYTVLVTPAIDTHGASYIQKFSANDAQGISSINLAYYFDKSTRPRGLMENIIQTIIDMLGANQRREEILVYIAKIKSDEQLELEIITPLFAHAINKDEVQRLLKVELDKLLAVQKDIFDEISDLVKSGNEHHIKILFPYNITQIHWLLGEVKIHIGENNHNYHVELTAHDPYGKGNLSSDNFKTLCEILTKKIRQLDEAATINITLCESSYTPRQQSGDNNSCGAIVVRDALCRIAGVGLSVEHPFDIGAPALRHEHMQLMQRATEVSVKNNFLQRHQLSTPVPPSPKVAIRRVLTTKPTVLPDTKDKLPTLKDASVSEERLHGYSLVNILQKAGLKFLKHNASFAAEPDKGHVYALAGGHSGKIVAIDMTGQPGGWDITGSARGEYFCNNNEFLVIKNVKNNDLKTTLEEKNLKTWLDAFDRFRKNTFPSEVEFVWVFSFSKDINEEKTLLQLGQLFLSLAPALNGRTIPHFRFYFPEQQGAVLSRKYSTEDCKKAFSPKKVKYAITPYVPASVACSPEEIFSQCKKDYEEILDSDQKFLRSNVLFCLIKDKSDIKADIKYFLPQELISEELKSHYNDLINRLNLLSSSIERCLQNRKPSDKTREQLQKLHVMIREYQQSITFMRQKILDLQKLYLGDEKSEKNARQKLTQMDGKLLAEFKKNLVATLQLAPAEKEIEAWFKSHEFTALACISSILRAFQFANTSLEQNTAKMLCFYWMLENPAAQLRPLAKQQISTPSPILALVRAEDKELDLKNHFNAMIRCLAEGFNEPGNRKENLRLKLKNFAPPASENLSTTILVV